MTWTSSDESIATVDENGIIKALAAGKTTITATFNGVSAECLLTVSEKTAPGTDEGNNDGTTAGTENKATENSPKTGDDFNMIVPIMLMIATAAGAGAVLFTEDTTHNIKIFKSQNTSGFIPAYFYCGVFDRDI